MGSHISAIQSAASSVFAALSAALTDLRVGVGAYRDFGDAFVFNNIQPVTAGLTPLTFAAQVNAWAAAGGGDWPEAQLHALHRVATQPSIAWRTSSIKIVVWFGDAPGHDPSGGVSLNGALAALQVSTTLRARASRQACMHASAHPPHARCTRLTLRTSWRRAVASLTCRNEQEMVWRQQAIFGSH